MQKMECILLLLLLLPIWCSGLQKGSGWCPTDHRYKEKYENIFDCNNFTSLHNTVGTDVLYPFTFYDDDLAVFPAFEKNLTGTVSIDQMTALEDFYVSLNGSNWIWKTSTNYSLGVPWNFTGGAEVHNACVERWQGIGCNCNTTMGNSSICNVIQIILFEANLAGRIPSSIGNFTEMTFLNVMANQISGTVPTEMRKLTKMEGFILLQNQFTGNMPWDAMLEMKNLSIVNFALNLFNGTIPKSIMNMTQLTVLYISHNYLSGTIPMEVAQLENVHSVELGANFLTGTIPKELFAMKNNLFLYLYTNLFTGTIPNDIPRINNSFESVINLNENLLTSTLPISLCNMTGLNVITMASNFFTGSIPDCYGNLTSMVYFEVYDNMLTNTLPRSLRNWHIIKYFDIGVNAFSGMLPYLGKWIQIVELLININLLSGTLPPDLAVSSHLIYAYMERNQFTGTVPSVYGVFPILKEFRLYDNQLTGSLPATLSNLTQLELMFFEDNSFSGNLDFVFNGTTQTLLTNIDLSNNEFTGKIPTEPFKSPMLQSFATVSNCFHGTVPAEICIAPQLQALALDGQSTGVACRRLFFPAIPGSDTYLLPIHHVNRKIPSCLFNMTTLVTLHLSGNELTGSLPSDLTIGPLLQDVSLSHNSLTGTIPTVIQERSWVNLDLSFNRLTGHLSQRFSAVADNASLSLQVNRLSGDIPDSLRTALNISILNGNLFDCDISRHSLPINDDETPKYLCGSDSTNRSLIGFAVLAGLTAGFALLVTIYSYRRRNHPQSTRSLFCCKWTAMEKFCNDLFLWLEIFDSNYANGGTDCETAATGRLHHNFPSIYGLGVYMRHVRQRSLFITALAVVVLMPVYYGISFYSDSYENEYIWVVSAGFLSGTTSGYSLFALLMVVIIILLYSFLQINATKKQNNRNSSPRNNNNQSSSSNSRASNSVSRDSSRLSQFSVYGRLSAFRSSVSATAKSPTFWLSAIAIINFLVLIPANAAYVYLSIYYNIYVIRVAQFCLALFKLFWNDAVLGWSINRVKELLIEQQQGDIRATAASFAAAHNSNSNSYPPLSSAAGGGEAAISSVTHLYFQIILVLMNNIAIPCLAIAAISVDCFYNVVVPPPNVDSSYEYIHCSLYWYVLPAHTYYCTDSGYFSYSTSYLPPFTYSYECSSTILTNYAVVFIYMLLFGGFVIPLCKIAGAWVYNTSAEGSTWRTLADQVTPHNLRPLRLTFNTATAAAGAAGADSLTQQRCVQYFDKVRFVVRTTNFFAILVTYGVIFPLMAVVAMTAVYTTSYYEQLVIGRLLYHAKEAKLMHYFAIVNEECKHFNDSLRYVVWVLMTLAAFFYAFFIFDTLGDVTSAVNTGITAGIMAATPLIFWLLSETLQYSLTHGLIKNSRLVEMITKRKESMHEMEEGEDIVINPVTIEKQDSVNF